MAHWFCLSCGLVGIALAAALVILFLVPHDVLPERVPIHWNAAMEPDGWIRLDAVNGRCHHFSLRPFTS